MIPSELLFQVEPIRYIYPFSWTQVLLSVLIAVFLAGMITLFHQYWRYQRSRNSLHDVIPGVPPVLDIRSIEDVILQLKCILLPSHPTPGIYTAEELRRIISSHPYIDLLLELELKLYRDSYIFTEADVALYKQKLEKPSV
jgi:hypothetical protein